MIHVPHPYIRKLEKMLDTMGNLYTAQDIIDEVKANRMQMFCLKDSIIISRVNVHPRGKSVDVIGAVGKIEDIVLLSANLIKFAEEIGAKVVQTYGRRGWVDEALRNGWKVKTRGFIFQRDI